MEVTIAEICDLLQSHANRDKVVSLASYVLKLWGAVGRREPLLQASARLASARASTRLFDDAAALRAMLNHGLGAKEGALWGALGAAGGACTLAYLQAEKLAWLIDCGLLTLTSVAEARVRVAHKLFWSLFSAIAFVRSLRALHIAGEELKLSRRKCSGARFTQAALVSSKLLLDVVHTVSWLPAGWLWGGRLRPAHSAAVASLAAALALTAHYHAKQLRPT